LSSISQEGQIYEISQIRVAWEAGSVTSVESDPAAHQASPISGHPDDRFLWTVPLFALGCEITLAVLTYLERLHGAWLILALVLFVLIVSVMIFVAGIGILALAKGRFKRAAALLLAPLIVASPFIFPIVPFEYHGLELLRLYLNKGYYDAVIEKLPAAERASKVVFFDWGATGFMLAATDYALVYDESGESALPDEARSQAWNDRVYPQEHWDVNHCVTSAHHLIGHYYSVAIRCAY
jgi:hypothetical protein